MKKMVTKNHKKQQLSQNSSLKFARPSILWAAIPLAIIAFIDSLAYGMIAPVFPVFRDAAELSNSTTSLLSGFFAIGVILGFPLRILLLKLITPRTLLILAALIGSVSYAVFHPSLAEYSMIALFALRALQGFASSFFFNGIMMTILQLNKEERLSRFGAVLGIVFSMYALGNVIAPLAGLLPNPLHFFYIISALTLLTLPVILIWAPKTGKAVPYLDLQVLKQTHVRIGWLTALVCGVSIGIIMVSVPLMLSSVLSSTELGMLYALAALPLVFLSPVVGGIVQRTQKTTRLIMLSSIFLLLVTMFTAVSSMILVVLVVLCLAYAVMSLVETGGMTVMARDGVKDKGYIMAASLYGIFYDIGWSLGPASVSWLEENTPVNFMLSISIICGATILIVLLVWIAVSKKKTEEIDTLTGAVNIVNLPTGAHPSVSFPAEMSTNVDDVNNVNTDTAVMRAVFNIEYMDRQFGGF